MSKPVTFGIAMGTAALGMAIGYLSGQGRSTVACSPTAPLYQHVKESPAKDVVQQEAPAKPLDPAKVAAMTRLDPGTVVPPGTLVGLPGGALTGAGFADIKGGKYEPHIGVVLKSNGHDCAWLHHSGGQWKAESLIHFGQSQIFATYEQAVEQTRERWCKS